ncbi:DUF2066 domain-containing protein [Bradyrhizobium sp. HKCCYLS3077]|uniref:DUF2066 domain-containing protein n=1 Tax=Bradyrhizobium sp. HKCCYLS3077 TaxID=3420761 RepID=UPI003EBD279E
MTRLGVPRWWMSWCLGLWLAVGAFSIADAETDSLYQAQTVVTGQGADNRQVGFAACLEDVLIKVSGAFQLSGDPRLAPLKARAAEFVTRFDYHDQMSGKPKRDEQGTRDRPYDLTVMFDRPKIDDLLVGLHVKPWLARRPTMAAMIVMTPGGRSYAVVSDGRQSDLQRDALYAAAGKRGLDVVLPNSSAVANVGFDGIDLIQATPAALTAHMPAADVQLFGHLTWDDAELAWSTQWRLENAGKSHRWQFRGVTFDEAFRRALGGAAQILSDNGSP